MKQIELRNSQAMSRAALQELIPYEREVESLGIDPTEFREALSHAATAVTVVTTMGEGGLAGVTCSAVCSVCDAPPVILVCINRRSAANPVIKRNGVLCVNWLAAGQSALSQLFSGVGRVPMPERFDSGQWDVLETGSPCRTDALVALDCTLDHAMEIGTHSVFLAKVVATARTANVDPLVYCRRSYATTLPLNS